MMYVETLSEFIEWASQFKDGQYLFRGVPNDNFEIEASAYRRLPEADSGNPSKLLRINQRLIEDARSLGHDRKNGEQLSDLELLAELQHFGAATCLIDFTRSALDALWFACLKNPKEEANGKVFAVRYDDVARLRTVTPKLIKEDINYFFQSDENGRYPLYQWAPKLQNNRIIAQHSVFLFGGAQIEVATECVIIKSSKQEILTSLEEVSDITEATMYPDFDGFARLHAHDKPHIESDAKGCLQRGIEAHQNNNLDDAIAYYTEIIRLDPDISILTTTYDCRGLAYSDKGDYDRAIVDFTEAIEPNPNHYTYYNRGVAYLKKGDYNRAIEDFTEAIELNPDDAEAYNNRGLAYNNEDDYGRAIEDFTKAIQLNPNYSIAYNNRGLAYRDKDDYDRAIVDFNMAIELKPDLAEAHYNRGLAYIDKGDYDRTIVDCNTAIALNPDYADAYNNRGLAYSNKGEYERSIVDFNTAIELKPDDAIAYNNRGNAYNNKGEVDHAIEDFTTAIALNPDYAEAYNNRGLADQIKGDIDRAIVDFTTAIERKPDLAEAYNNRGEAWLHLDEWKRAKSDLMTAKNMGMDIIATFHNVYRSVAIFEQVSGVKLPADIAAMLTPQ